MAFLKAGSFFVSFFFIMSCFLVILDINFVKTELATNAVNI